MTKKCKSSSHVDVVAGPAGTGDPTGYWSLIYVEHGACRNVAGDHELYVLTRNGKPGLQMLPDLAAVMPARLRDAARTGPAVRIRHNVLKVKVTYATLSAAAAVQLADQIELALR